MVLAFESNYDKESHTQTDKILIQQGPELFTVQRRINLFPLSEMSFAEQDKAETAFEKLEL